ncbi:MAG: hypothetical protein AAFY60_14875 [Myxococcota bacterium]
MSGSVTPISTSRLDAVREDSPEVARGVESVNQALTRSARSGSRPARASVNFGSNALADEVARRFRSAGFDVRITFTQGIHLGAPTYNTVHVTER